jgi:uncharacterized protein YbjT (DUF2867 family)
MRIVIFGANGQTGRLLTRRVLDAGHTAVAVRRNPDGFPFANPRLEVAGADVRDAASVVGAVDGAATSSRRCEKSRCRDWSW